MEISHEIAIARPAAEVFAALVDWERHPEWIEGLVASEALDGRPALGQRFRQRLERGPLVIELEGEVVDFSEPTRLGFEARARDVRMTSRVELVEQEGSTRLSNRTLIELESFLLKMLASKLRAELEAKQEQDLARLKRRLEG